MPDTPASEHSHFRFPTLSVLLWLSGSAALFFSSHNKLIGTASAAILGVVWTAFVGLTSKIWARVEKTIVELVGDALDIYIRDFASRYRKRYLEHLQHRHRTFDVKGLSTQGIYALEIEQVYVELTVDPTLAGKASANPIAKIEGGRHNIWTFLSSPQMKQQDFAVLGAPGSGKTTLLKHISLGLAANKGKFQGVKRLPVLLFIRDHAASIAAKPDKTIADVAEEAATKMGIPSPAGWFDRELARGRCLIMLDGLDEVADSNLRKTVADWVEKQLQAFGANRFLISSRPFGYKSNPLSNVTVLEVRPFSSEQSEKFIRNWYLANEVMSAQKNDEGVQIAAREGAADLLKRIHSAPALAELAVNPLLLTMIANVHRYRSSLPGRRVELYAEICEVFLGKRQQARGMELDLTPAQKKRVLQPLAYHMMCAEKREIASTEAIDVIRAPLALVNDKIAPEEFLRNVENSSGLLLERENGIYSFAHLTFQEYLAASHCVEEKLGEDLASKVTIPWWHEVIRLYVASADASRIIEACFVGDSVGVVTLTLAMECLDEAMAVRSELRSKIESIVIAGLEDASPQRARLAAETKLALRLRRLTRIDDDHYVDSELISCAEYQLFIDDRRAVKDYRQPDHWERSHFTPGKAQSPVLGVRPSDAKDFCAWLCERFGGQWDYQIPDSNSSAQWSNKESYWASDTKGIRLCGERAWSSIKLPISMIRDRERLDLEQVMGVSPQDLADALRHGVGSIILRRYSHGSNIAQRHDLKSNATRARAVDLARALAKVFGQKSGTSKVLDALAAVSHSAYLDLDLVLDRAKQLDTEMANQSGIIVNLNQTLMLAFNRYETRAIDRAVARTLLLGAASMMDRNDGRIRWYQRALDHLKGVPPMDMAGFADFTSIYISLVILEERIIGNLSAFEGIRITKVRKGTPVEARTAHSVR
jgi:hypothetical protein